MPATPRVLHRHATGPAPRSATLAIFNPQPVSLRSTNALDGLIDDARGASNALNAGLPANFLVANPDLSRRRRDHRQRRLHEIQLAAARAAQAALARAAVQRQLRVRHARTSSERTRSRDRGKNVLQTGGRRWRRPRVQGELDLRAAVRPGPPLRQAPVRGSTGSIGGWSFDGIARIQSGQLLDFGNVRLVGMTHDELQDNVQDAVRR